MSFQAAVAKADQAKVNGKRLNNEQLLSLYAHFKQGTVGPNTTPKPGFLDVKGGQKWKAWTALGGMTQAAAQAKYVQLVNQWI